MMLAIMFAVWGVLGASVPEPNATTTEEVGFSALLSRSHTHMAIQAVGAEAQAARCSDGDLLDWAAYQYQTPDGYDGYSPADRWRCVKKTDPDTAYKAKHYSPPRMKPPLPAVAQTGFYSNLDAETYKLFKKQIGTSGSNGFAWKVSDKEVLTFTSRLNPPGARKPDNPEDARPTWDVLFNDYTYQGKKSFYSIQKSDHALYAEPKVRLFHQGPRYDLFVVSSKDFTGANKYFLWHIDKEKGTAYWEEKKDTLTLDKFERSEYILDKGVLWRIHESRLIRGQRNRIFTYKTYENGSFEAWRQGTPGPQPPPTTFPPAETE
jgi:hypothetical protein